MTSIQRSALARFYLTVVRFNSAVKISALLTLAVPILYWTSHHLFWMPVSMGFFLGVAYPFTRLDLISPFERCLPFTLRQVRIVQLQTYFKTAGALFFPPFVITAIFTLAPDREHSFLRWQHLAVLLSLFPVWPVIHAGLRRFLISWSNALRIWIIWLTWISGTIGGIILVATSASSPYPLLLAGGIGGLALLLTPFACRISGEHDHNVAMAKQLATRLTQEKTVGENRPSLFTTICARLFDRSPARRRWLLAAIYLRPAYLFGLLALAGFISLFFTSRDEATLFTFVFALGLTGFWTRALREAQIGRMIDRRTHYWHTFLPVFALWLLFGLTLSPPAENNTRYAGQPGFAVFALIDRHQGDNVEVATKGGRVPAQTFFMSGHPLDEGAALFISTQVANDLINRFGIRIPPESMVIRDTKPHVDTRAFTASINLAKERTRRIMALCIFLGVLLVSYLDLSGRGKGPAALSAIPGTLVIVLLAYIFFIKSIIELGTIVVPEEMPYPSIAVSWIGHLKAYAQQHYFATIVFLLAANLVLLWLCAQKSRYVEVGPGRKKEF
jgi:hypothetical protein